MEKLMNMEEFAGCICELVKEDLFDWQEKMKVRVACIDTGEDGLRLLLLISRSWCDIQAGFYLDGWYKDYRAGTATVESITDAIIGNDRLYNAFYDTDFLHDDNADTENGAEREMGGEPVRQRGLRGVIGGYLRKKMQMFGVRISK